MGVRCVCLEGKNHLFFFVFELFLCFFKFKMTQISSNRSLILITNNINMIKVVFDEYF